MGLGFTAVRHLAFWLAMIVLVMYIGKFVTNADVCKTEYSNVIPASLYAGFSMLMMLIGSYIFDVSPAVGKAIWLCGVIIHACHILVFTYRNVVKGVNLDTFMPSWFVTYNGIMVSCVTGGPMNMPGMLKVITWYGIAVFTVIIPFMIWRLAAKPIKDAVFHTQAVVLAPCSLCVVSYLNVIENPNRFVLYYLYAAVIIALVFIIYRLPAFFRYEFTPGYAGLTFPMAIGIVATGKMSGYLDAQGMIGAAGVLKQLQGFQIVLTTGIIIYVLIQFFILLKKNFTAA